jgi:hypothetical protein
MRDAILIGALYAALGAIVAALAVKYAAPSALWDIMLWGGVALAIGCVASLWFSASHQATGRPFLLPSACISLGLCLIAFGFVWHASQAAVDNEYIFFRVEISDPKNLSLTNLPVWITNASPGPFEHVDSWFAPWTPPTRRKRSKLLVYRASIKTVYPGFAERQRLIRRNYSEG